MTAKPQSIGANLSSRGELTVNPKKSLERFFGSFGSANRVLCGTLFAMENDNEDKHQFLLKLLSEGDAMVCLDARLPNVVVPKVHKANAALNLVFNLSSRRPLEINGEGIFSTLAFNGRPHKCVIPYEAIWAVYEPASQEGQVWEDAIPKDLNLAEKILGKAQDETAGGEKSRISVQQGGKTEVAKKPASAKKDRSHLRVIK